jgi:hypothetical protein
MQLVWRAVALILNLTIAPLAAKARPRSRDTRKTEERKNANNSKTP